jgi:hypothetical protein
VVTNKPEEIPDADHELMIERVCAVDVAKASGKVCVRVPHQSTPGRRVSKVWDVAAMTGAVTELGGPDTTRDREGHRRVHIGLRAT